MTVKTLTLDNGLLVAAESLDAVESSAISIILPRGSAFDPDDKKGVASMLTEMMIRGAGDRDARALTDTMDALGLERSVDFSAEFLSLSGAVLTYNLRESLGLFRDLWLAPRLEESEIEPARSLCIQSVESIEDHPPEKLFVELKRRALTAPFNRPSKGIVSELETITISDLKLAASKLAARGAIIAIAGNRPVDTLIDEVQKCFSAAESGEEYPRAAAGPPSSGRDHFVKPSLAQTQIGLIFPSLPLNHPDYMKVRLLVTILSGGMSGRLFVEVREKRGLVYSVRSFYSAHRTQGYIYAYAGTTPDRAAETIDVLEAEFKRLREGTDEEEFSKAKTQLKSALVMSLETPRARASAMASDLFYLDHVRQPDDILASIEAVTLPEMNEFLSGAFTDDPFILTLGPNAKESAS